MISKLKPHRCLPAWWTSADTKVVWVLVGLFVSLVLFMGWVMPEGF